MLTMHGHTYVSIICMGSCAITCMASTHIAQLCYSATMLQRQFEARAYVTVALTYRPHVAKTPNSWSWTGNKAISWSCFLRSQKTIDAILWEYMSGHVGVETHATLCLCEHMLRHLCGNTCRNMLGSKTPPFLFVWKHMPQYVGKRNPHPPL